MSSRSTPCWRTPAASSSGGARQRLGFPEPAPQQAGDDAQSEGPQGPRDLQAAGRRRPTWWSRISAPTSRRKLGIDYESVRKINPRHRLWQHLRLRPGWPLSQAPGLRSDRAGHGRADVDHRRARRGPDAGRHSRGRSHRRAVLRHGHPDRAAGARRLRRRPVGADLAAAGPDLHAGFPGLALADGKGRRQAGRQRPSDQHSHRRVQDLRRLHQHRHRGRPDLGALRAGARRARACRSAPNTPPRRTARRTARRSMPRSTSSPKRNRPTPGSRS